jgi:hypothetical protein
MAIQQYDDLPLLPGERPKPKAPGSTAYGVGQAARATDKRLREAVKDAAVEVTRPVVEPLLRNGAEVLGNAAEGISGFIRGAVGAEPAAPAAPASPAAPAAPAGTSLSPVQDAEARTGTGARPGPVHGQAGPPTTPGFAARFFNGDGPAPQVQGQAFTTLPAAPANAALDSTEPGTAVIQGRFLKPDGTRGPATARSYTEQGVQDAGKRLNVVHGLFSGVSGETERALSEARKAAAARGDFEGVDRSYLSGPEDRAAYDAGKAEKALIRRLPNLPAALIPGAVQSLGQLRAKAVPQLPTLSQVKGQRFGQLAQNPGAITEADKLAFGDRGPRQERKLYRQPTYDENGFQTGEVPYLYDGTGNAQALNLPGAAGASGAGKPRSREAIRAAYQAGEIGRDEARALLAQ